MTEPPLILALHEDTNANAALLRGGEILAAVAEERLSREKFQAGFPTRAVASVLAQGGVTLDQVDALVAGNRFHFLPRLPGGERLIGGEHDLLGLSHKAWLGLQARLPGEGPLARVAEGLSRRGLAHRLGRTPVLVDHHSAHAWSAYLTSPFPEALAVSIDNMGDGFAARTFEAVGGRLRPLWGSDATASPGQFYGEISQLLGFHLLMAGKVTGLAARGDWRRAYGVMARLIALRREDTDFALPPLWSKSRRRGALAELSAFSPQDVAAAAQRRLEDVLVAYVRRGLRETGRRHLVLAGGVFANVLVNHRLWSLPEVEGLFVHPAMSDQGIAVGAALGWWAEQRAISPRPISHVFLGPGYSEEQLGAALEASGLRYRRVPDVDRAVAKAILARRVVGRFTGRLEYGPRALGNRSILVHTGDPTVNDWLNARLRRSEFMPFAPATLASHAQACFSDYGAGVDHTARFMTVTLRCSEAMRRLSPAVVHLDGTARPQIVHPEPDPGLHRILSLVHAASGVPSVINTSFNLHGEPIVCSPRDAIRAFLEGRLDLLALGPFVVER